MSFIQFQFRRGLASAWTSANPILADGELAIEKDSRQFKIGDGANTWSQLGYGGIVGPQGTLYPNVEFDVSFNANIFVGRDVSFSGQLFVNRDISVNGNLIVGKTFYSKPLSVLAGGSSSGSAVSIVASSNIIELSGSDSTNYFSLLGTGSVSGLQVTIICKALGSAGLFLGAATSFLINGSTVTQVRFSAVGQSMTVVYNGSIWNVVSWSGVNFQGGSMNFGTYGSGDINFVPAGKLSVTGLTQLNGNLSVINDISLSGRLIGLADASINGNVVVGRDVSVNRILRVVGNTLLAGNLFVERDVSFGQLLTVVGNTRIGGNLVAERDITVLGNAILTGNTLATQLIGLGDVSFNSNLMVGRDASLNGNLTVFGKAGFGGASTVDANYAVNVGGNINLSGNIYQNGVLFVGSGGSGVDYNSDFSLNANLRVGRDLSVNGILYVPRIGLRPSVTPPMPFSAEYIYDFSGAVVNSGTGVTLIDSSNGSPTYTTGKIGTLALTLNAASNQLVTLGQSGTQYQFLGTGFSVAFWLKTTSASSATFLDFFQGTGDRVKIYFDTSSGSTYLRVAINGNATLSSTLVANINDGNWRHFAFTLTGGGSGQVYINGVATGSPVTFGVYPTLSANKTVYIGASAVLPGDYLTGSIDQLIFANRVFNAAEPATLVGFIPSASLDTSVSNGNLQITGFVGNISSYGLSSSAAPFSGLINLVSSRNTVSVGDRVPIATLRQTGGTAVASDATATLAIGSSIADNKGAALDLMMSYADGLGQWSQPRVVSVVSNSATSGRVGINVAAPVAALDVSGNVNISGNFIAPLSTNFNPNVLTNPFMIGYTVENTTSTVFFTNSTYHTIGNITIEQPGIYNSFINVDLSCSGTNNPIVTFRNFWLSESDVSTVGNVNVHKTFKYLNSYNDSVGSNSIRTSIIISGVLNVQTVPKTFYLNGRVIWSQGSPNPSATAYYSYTKIA